MRDRRLALALLLTTACAGSSNATAGGAAVQVGGHTTQIVLSAPSVSTPSNAATLDAPDPSVVYLRIKRVVATPDMPGMLVHVTARVNNHDYEYPSTDGVMWTKIGPEMTTKTFPIPRSHTYDVGFHVRMKEIGAAQGDVKKLADRPDEATSNELHRVITLPFPDTYNLYLVELSGTGQDAVRYKSNNVAMVVEYLITETP